MNLAKNEAKRDGGEMLHLEFHVLRSPIALRKGLQGATR
jgi:hypothetical protein